LAREWGVPPLPPGVEPALDTKVAFLRDPASYPEQPDRVEALETHMSWVFMLAEFVYKLKKPVRYELLDFRTLAARRHFCHEEIRLNRRLAPGVYLEAVPLARQRRRLAIGGSGCAIDWLVRMRRLPAARMLDYALLHGALADSDIERIARRLAAFYLSRPAQPLGAEQYRAGFERRIASTTRALARSPFGLCSHRVAALGQAQLAALRRVGTLLDERVRAGRIVEGHGDLRPEHVYLGEPLAVIDCLEFSRALRTADMADEIGFLALELERLGAPAAGALLLQTYYAAAGDETPPLLIDFYQSCRAGTRALIAARHLLEAAFRHSPHWQRRTELYLGLAEQHVAGCV